MCPVVRYGQVACGDMCLLLDGECIVYVWCPLNERGMTGVLRCVRDMSSVKTVDMMCYEIKIGLMLPCWNMKCGCSSDIW